VSAKDVHAWMIIVERGIMVRAPGARRGRPAPLEDERDEMHIYPQ
jgi:hypothetical protein